MDAVGVRGVEGVVAARHTDVEALEDDVPGRRLTDAPMLGQRSISMSRSVTSRDARTLNTSWP